MLLEPRQAPELAPRFADDCCAWQSQEQLSPLSYTAASPGNRVHSRQGNVLSCLFTGRGTKGFANATEVEDQLYF